MANIKLKDLLAENMRRFKTKNLNENIDGITTTVGELLGMLNGINPKAEISLNYDGEVDTDVVALNYVDMEGLEFEEPEIILVGETTENHMTVGMLRTQLSKLDSNIFVTLNLDTDAGSQVVSKIQVDTEMADDSSQPEIILFGDR